MSTSELSSLDDPTFRRELLIVASFLAALSDAYEAERRDATERGWPTARLDSDHLAPFTQPELVLRCVRELARRFA